MSRIADAGEFAPFSAVRIMKARLQERSRAGLSDGIGRAAWNCGFIVPNGLPPPDIINLISAELAEKQQRYDLGVTREISA